MGVGSAKLNLSVGAEIGDKCRAVSVELSADADAICAQTLTARASSRPQPPQHPSVPHPVRQIRSPPASRNSKCAERRVTDRHGSRGCRRQDELSFPHVDPRGIGTQGHHPEERPRPARGGHQERHRGREEDTEGTRRHQLQEQREFAARGWGLLHGR